MSISLLIGLEVSAPPLQTNKFWKCRPTTANHSRFEAGIKQIQTYPSPKNTHKPTTRKLHTVSCHPSQKYPVSTIEVDGAYMPLPRRAKGQLQDLIVSSCEGEGEQGSGRKEKEKHL
jgi:hypothetical protein